MHHQETQPTEGTSENTDQSASHQAESAAKPKGKRGGRRPGAGAPKGNLNGLKHGRYSAQLAQLGLAMAASPKIQVTLLEYARKHQVKQQNAEKVAVTIFANILKKGIEIKNPRQARALAGFFDAVDRS